MATRTELLAEANKRGLLVGQQKTLFDEAQRRGLLGAPTTEPAALVEPGAAQPLATTVTPVSAAPQERTFGEQVLGALETAGTVVSGAIAEPVAGITGLVTGALTQDPAAASAVVEGVRERLTFQPRTEAGQEQLQAVGEFIQPAAEALEGAERTLGEATLKATGSPALAAAASTIPTALLELTGLASTKGITKLKTGRELDKAITSATPSIDQLKNASRQVFKEISAQGATVRPAAMITLTNNIERAARKAGARPRTTPETFGVIDEFKEIAESGRIIDLDELDELRTVAQNAAKSIDPAKKAPAIAMIDEIDGFLDDAGSDILRQPKGAPDVGPEYRAARRIWGKARKGEVIEEAFLRAKDTASGFENGLRIEFRKILKSKRQSKFFTDPEKAAMAKVSQGTRGANLAKLVGRFGFSEGQAINLINPVVGGAAGAAVFGAPGAVAVPIIGQVSKQLAQRLTKANATFADQVVRAGVNADLIAKAYMRNTPKKLQSASELAELFVKNEIDLSTVKSAIAKEAADLARAGRNARTGALAAGTLKPEEQTQ